MHKLLTWFLLFPFFAAVAAPPPKNFVNDGNFARGGAGWHYFDARGGEFLSSGGPQGQPCFKLGGTDYDNIIYLYNKRARLGWGISLQEGQTYTLSAWIKTQDVDLATLFDRKILYITNYGWTNAVGLGPDSGNSDWKRIQVTFKAPAQTHKKLDPTANVYSFLIFWPKGQKGTVWVTDIQIEEGSQATAFTDFHNLGYVLADEKYRRTVEEYDRIGQAAAGAGATGIVEQLKPLAAALQKIGQQFSGTALFSNAAVAAVNDELDRIGQELAACGSRVWLKNPLVMALPGDLPGRTGGAEPQALTLFANQTRSLGLMLTNFTGVSQDYRISAGDFVEQGSRTLVSGRRFISFFNTPLMVGDTDKKHLYTDLFAAAGPMGLTSVPSGSTRAVIACIDTGELAPGTYEGELLITNLGDYSRNQQIKLTLKVVPAALPERMKIDVAGFGQDALRPEEARRLGHNYQVLDGTSFCGLMDRQGNLLPTDYTTLDERIKATRKVDPRARFMILFSVGVRFIEEAAKQGISWPDERIKRAWQQWCRETVAEFAKLGVAPEEVYLQIADEPGEANAATLAALQRLALEAVPGLKTTATLTSFNPAPGPAVTEFYASLKHVVLLVKCFYDRAAIDYFRKKGIEVAVYDCWGSMETIDPTTYYRLMAARAWKLGLDGIFYWYRDDRNPNYSCVKYMSVIYPRRDGDTGKTGNPVVPEEGYDISRRYLAFEAGIQDYKMLTAIMQAADFARKRGGNAEAVRAADAFLSSYCDAALALDDPSGYPRAAKAGSDPAVLDRYNEKGAEILAALLQDDPFAAEQLTLDGNTLKARFNEPCRALIGYRVNGGMELLRCEQPFGQAEFTLELGRPGDIINLCTVKAVNARGRVLNVSPLIARKVTVDGSFPGYTPYPIADGIRVPGAQYVNNLVWVSPPRPEEHWARLQWNGERPIRRVRLYWMSRGGLPQERKIEARRNGVWRELIPAGPAAAAVEVFDFAPVNADAVQVTVPPGRGNRMTPNMIGLSEFEVE
ncbi:hypothetical protein SDC9_68348 [bioreactor metagenome]|uniref:Glycoside hydrolase 123 C-terminal domain-containing protein n=1 Tax=bioreactor metagenome TaxID=1076179 RepID=A0A644Y1K2_9ZZZZ